jgi:hypothetical protein
MATDRRSDEAIRADIGTERDELTRALADLRQAVAGTKRSLTKAVGSTLAVGLAATAAAKVVRHLRRD